MSEGIGKCELCGKERPLMRTEFAYWHCADCDPVEKTKLFTLEDLREARADERARCVDAVVDSTHGGALRSAVDAIRSLGPISETPSEPELRGWAELVDKAIKELESEVHECPGCGRTEPMTDYDIYFTLKNGKKSLGPIGDIIEDTARRVRRETVEKMCAFIARADLLQFKNEIDAIVEGK